MRSQKIEEKIRELKEKENAIILAHNYQRPEVQRIADYLGDSLDLARRSAKVDCKLIVFAGVKFMAEMAAILNPERTVLMPDLTAGCPLAEQLSAQAVREAKQIHPNAAVVLYVNTLAEAKAEADVCCTSANAAQIVNALDEDEVLFGPDHNLAWYTQRRSNKHIVPLPERGYCYVHRMFQTADIARLKEEYPDAEVLVHPECDPEVQKLAGHICSTSQMMTRAKASHAKRFIIGTEIGMVERLRREFPDKEFIPALETAICEDMKKHTLEKIYLTLCDRKNIVRVQPRIAGRACAAIERMLELSGRATRD